MRPIERGGGVPEPLAPSDLGRARSGLAVVREVEPVGPGCVELVLDCAGVARAARPGEFCQLRVAEGPVPLLRRPFSVCRTDPAAGTVTVHVGVVGAGTRRLAAAQLGDRIGVLGPLGRGFTVPSGPGTLLMVAGGLGAAPFPLLAAAGHARGAKLVWLNGAATAARLYPVERLGAPVEAHVATEDGSRGRRGRVTDLLPALLGECDRIAACGPNPMLAAVARTVAARAPGLPLEVSLEAPMGCGIGTCLGCALPVVGAPALALLCRAGPVLPAVAVDWGRLGTLPPAHAA